MEHKNPSEL